MNLKRVGNPNPSDARDIQSMRRTTMLGTQKKLVSLALIAVLTGASLLFWNWGAPTPAAQAVDGFGLLRADTSYRIYTNTAGCVQTPPTIKVRMITLDRNSMHSQESIKWRLGHSLNILSRIQNHPCHGKRYLSIDGTVEFGDKKAAEFKAQLEWLGNAASREFLTISSFRKTATPPGTDLTKFLTDWSAGEFMREKTSPPRPASLGVRHSRRDGLSIAGHSVKYADVPRMQRAIENIQHANPNEKQHLEYAKFAIDFFAKYGDGWAKGEAPGKALRKLAETNMIAALKYYYASDCNTQLKALAKKRPEGGTVGSGVAVGQYTRKCLANEDYAQFAAFQDVRRTLIASGWAIGADKLTVTRSAGPSKDAVQKALHRRLVASAKAADPLYRSMVPVAGEATVCDQDWCVLRNTVQFRWHVASSPDCTQRGSKTWNCRFKMRQVVRVKSGWMGQFGWGRNETPWQQQMLSTLGRSAEFDAMMQMRFADGNWVDSGGTIKGHRSGRDIRW